MECISFYPTVGRKFLTYLFKSTFALKGLRRYMLGGNVTGSGSFLWPGEFGSNQPRLEWQCTIKTGQLSYRSVSLNCSDGSSINAFSSRVFKNLSAYEGCS